jgi:thiamine biosynthesis lipoprotein
MGKLLFFHAGIAILFLAGCSKPVQSRSGFALATICTITLYDNGSPQVYRDIFARIGEIERRMSVFIEGSDVDRINKAAGIEAVNVHLDVFDVIERAVHYAELSGGAFDPAVEPLVALWGIGGERPRVPAREEIDRVLLLINWRDIELDRENKTVFLKKPGMALDLGAIAKGYAADEAAVIIKKARIPQAMIDIGGNILTVGEKKDGSLWKIGIQNPVDVRGSYIGIIGTRGKSLVTSGVYERFFVADGIHYHHIFSPSLGYPADNGLLSVSIIADASIDADALSTAVFVLGYEKGRTFVESLEGVEAVFVFNDRGIRLTGNVDFTLVDENYRIVND